MNIIKILDLQHAQQLMNPKLLQPLHRQRRWQRGQQHPGFSKLLEHALREQLGGVPFQRVVDEVLLDEGAARFLPFQMRLFVVGRGEASEVGGLGEGDYGGLEEGGGGGGDKVLCHLEQVSYIV
jgi:hypothetical protein